MSGINNGMKIHFKLKAVIWLCDICTLESGKEWFHTFIAEENCNLAHLV